MTPDKDLAARLAELPAGEWTVWTSNSYRRISSAGDGDVLHAYTQRSDGHPDLSMTEGQLEAICWLVNSARSGQLITRAEADAMVAAETDRCAREAERHFIDAGFCALRERSAGKTIAAAIRAAQPAPAKGGE